MHARLARESGTVMVITLLVLMALTVLGLATIFLAGQGNETAITSRAGEQALYVAEAGVNWGMDAEAQTPALSANGYKTVSYGGTNPDVILKDNANASITFAGGQNAVAGVSIGPDPDHDGKTMICALPGYSDTFGQVRFMVQSRGFGPAGSQREVEAHVILPPRDGICPPSTFIGGGYSGG